MTDTKKAKVKEIVLAELTKTPIIEAVCKRAGISRATFYRWRKEDMAFAEVVNEAIVDGTQIINDMAESQLISSIRDKNMTAIIFWLKNHHTAYKTRVEVTAKTDSERELTPEQTKEVQRALALAAIDTGEKECHEPSSGRATDENDK